jgi:putative endopeptidase
MKKLIIMMSAAIVLSACGPKQAKVPAIDLTNLDTSVAPGDDFYQYATGGWQKKNPLKPEYARFGTFDQLSETNVERLNDLFAGMTTMKTEKGTVEQKISDLYKQGLDSVKLNQDGAAPLKGILDRIYSIKDKNGLVELVADMHNSGQGGFFGAYVGSDMVDSDSQILNFGQSGLGIGDRDYYIKPENAALKEGYRAFLEKIFALAGNPEPKKASMNALAVEDVLAENSWDSIKERDVEAQYNVYSSETLQKSFPGFDWNAYLTRRGIPEQKKLVVGEPDFFEKFGVYFANEDLSILKDYLAARVISGAASSLSDDFYAASFDFFSTQMSGIKEQKPRWKRAMQVPNGILGQAVGKMYVEKYFPASSKEKMETLVENLKIAFSQHIDELDWMGDETKAKAHEKLDNFIVKIGYPDEWKDYSTLDIDPDKSYYENILAARKWSVADNLSKLGKPTDRTEWGMSPQTVNAYYNPSTNEICFPAAILQPPFFNPDADDAVNYGGIGVVIGHEMSHGFDDQGRLFDSKGNMSGWWTADDDAKFKAKAKILAEQFDAVEVLPAKDGQPALMANGQLSLGENIGDHGGLSIAYTAMHNAIAGKDPGLIDGFTPDQRFYLGYAAVWAQNITDQEKARRTRQDVHSLAVNRVNVSVKNFQSFFDAFGIKEGDPMWRPESERVHIW